MEVLGRKGREEGEQKGEGGGDRKEGNRERGLS